MEFCKNPFVYMEVGNVQVTMRRKEERSIENAAAII